MNAMKPKNLGMAYNIQNKGMRKMMSKGGSVGCRECMAIGGKCMAHGGDIENEKMHPEHEGSMAADMLRDEDLEYSQGDNESEDARYAQGGKVQKQTRQSRLEEEGAGPHRSLSLTEAVMADRARTRKLAKGGAVMDENPVEDDFETRIDMEPVHTREDKEHDIESGSLDDESLVGQIMRDRRKRRGGME